MFGSTCFLAGKYDTPELNSRYLELFADVYNYATLPFYWGSYEPERGKTNATRLFELVEWCDRLKLEKKGHPLHWHEGAPEWLSENDFPNLETIIKKRLSDIIRTFKGKVSMWDIVNEITRAKSFTHRESKFNLISRFELQKGEANVVDMLSRLVMEIDPEARLLLNECNIHKSDFYDLLVQLRKMETPLYGIGLQSHMHEGTQSLEYIWKQNERYGAFGLPLHYTELSILSGIMENKEIDWYSPNGNIWRISEDSEEIQAREARDIYTVLFGHPAVEAVTWWDTLDGYWLSAPSGLISHDMEPKPAYYAVKKLIKEDWWTRAEGKTNLDGAYTTNAFYGEHRIVAVIDGMPIARDYYHTKHEKSDSLVTITLQTDV